MCFPLFLSGQEIIERIEIAGNKRIPRETILFYLSMKEGRYFDREYLRKDFKALWSTGFFSDIKIEEKKGTKGKIIKIIVEENPLLKEITYNTGKKLR
ncbi:MAG: outer membrane protein assembly factor BamA, partial [Candidatus Aminicenantes bacterium]|nr:outer membrane protein assembly factor BamA [Candidatus Aminicenantes bacterium]